MHSCVYKHVLVFSNPEIISKLDTEVRIMSKRMLVELL